MRTLAAAAVLLLAAVAPAVAQTAALVPCPAGALAAGDTARPAEVTLSASARIGTLRFETRPEAGVRLRGCAPLDTVVVDRGSLPDPVQPGVTYRDVTVGIEARGFLQVECLLPAVLGDSASAGALADLCAAPAADSVPPGTPRTPRR